MTTQPDVAKIRTDAESWLKTYASWADSRESNFPGFTVLPTRSVPSDEWDWLNGRCHPSIVLALCEKIAALEAEVAASKRGVGGGLAAIRSVDGGWGGA